MHCALKLIGLGFNRYLFPVAIFAVIAPIAPVKSDQTSFFYLFNMFDLVGEKGQPAWRVWVKEIWLAKIDRMTEDDGCNVGSDKPRAAEKPRKPSCFF